MSILCVCYFVFIIQLKFEKKIAIVKAFMAENDKDLQYKEISYSLKHFDTSSNRIGCRNLSYPRLFVCVHNYMKLKHTSSKTESP